MKHTIKLYITLLMFFGISACSDDFYDVNTPYGAAFEEELSMKDLLSASIFHTFDAQYAAASDYGYYTQYFTTRSGTTIGNSFANGLWSNSYLHVLPNLDLVIEKAEQSNSNYYIGIAKTLTALNLGLLTDSYENIPYSQASFREENFKPAFDTQPEIYTTIMTLLDEAIIDLSSQDNSEFHPSNDDLVFQGDISKWIKTAYMLKARYTMHLSEKQNVANEVLGYLDQAYTSNDDDFELFYDSRNINPWHSVDVLAANTGNFHRKIGDQLVSLMNGSFYPLNDIPYDPRLPVYADNTSDGEPFRGYESGGLGLSSDGESGNTDFADEGYYSSLDSPIVILSYAEAQFLRAEAEFIANGGTTTSTGSTTEAYMAYRNGIKANLNKLELGLEGDKYLDEASIKVGMENLELNHIMKEKYIALFLNPETYVDYRRYDFSDQVYRGLELPLDNEDFDYPGEWYLRSQYPSVEAQRNAENVAANAQTPITPVWWDE